MGRFGLGSLGDSRRREQNSQPGWQQRKRLAGELSLVLLVQGVPISGGVPSRVSLPERLRCVGTEEGGRDRALSHPAAWCCFCKPRQKFRVS